MCYEFSLISVKSVVLFGLRLTVLLYNVLVLSKALVVWWNIVWICLICLFVLWGLGCFRFVSLLLPNSGFDLNVRCCLAILSGVFLFVFFLLLHFLTCRVNTYYACCIIIFNIRTVITISEIQLFRNGCRILFQLWIFINFHFRFFKNFFIYFFELRNTCFYSRFGSFR